jgi:peptide/nickel transport system ATP-binding protein
MSSLLSVRDLTVELPIDGSFFPAVEEVSFDLAEGEALAVVGESGCGKTILARALIGLPPEGARVRGSVVYAGRDLMGFSEREWERVRGGQIAMVFQEPGAALDPVRTIGEQIVEAIRSQKSVSPEAARDRARRLLAEVSFPDPERGLREYAHRLSGGLRQRAFLAIALAADPAILLADEPTTALDATVAAEVMELMGRLRRERRLSLVLITHDLAAAARYADRVLVLYSGKIVESATSRELFLRPRHPYTRGLLACRTTAGERGSGRREFRTIPGGVPDLASRPRGSCAFAPRCADRFAECETAVPVLQFAGESLARCFLYGPGAPASGIGRESRTE